MNNLVPLMVSNYRERPKKKGYPVKRWLKDQWLRWPGTALTLIGLCSFIILLPWWLVAQGEDRGIARAATQFHYAVGSNESCNMEWYGGTLGFFKLLASWGNGTDWGNCIIVGVSKDNRYYTTKFVAANTHQVVIYKFPIIAIGQQ